MDRVHLHVLAEATAQVRCRLHECHYCAPLTPRVVRQDLAHHVADDVEVPLAALLEPGQPELAHLVLHLREAMRLGLLVERERGEQIEEEVVENRELRVLVGLLNHRIPRRVVGVVVVPHEATVGAPAGAITAEAVAEPAAVGEVHLLQVVALRMEAARVDIVHDARVDAEELLLGPPLAPLLVPRQRRQLGGNLLALVLALELGAKPHRPSARGPAERVALGGGQLQQDARDELGDGTLLEGLVEPRLVVLGPGSSSTQNTSAASAVRAS